MPSNLIQRLKDQKSTNGVSAYDHLIQVIERVADVKEHNMLTELQNFELLSDLIKKDHFLYKQPKIDREVNNIPEKKGLFNQWIQQSHKVLQVYFMITQANPRQQVNEVQPFHIHSRQLQQAGLGFGEEESYRIWQSLIKLSTQTNATSIRFWGKILCSGNDYLIAEGNIQNRFADEAPQGSESFGIGCNKLTFWACHSVLDEWVELPFVTPQQIQVSKKISYMFTGNLNAKIESYPVFSGLEKHLLKSLLVRITYAALIVPKGIYKANDDNPKEIEFEEEVKLPELSELQSLENWVHLHPQILNVGRITHLPPQGLSEEETQAYLDEQNEKDPENERLKAISEDRPYIGYETNWLIRNLGEQQVFNQIGKDEGTQQNYGCVSLKSLTWPGMVTVGWNKGYCSIYVGYGNKNGSNTFEPIAPSDIIDDPEDTKEMPEPNPKNAPVEVVEGEQQEQQEGDAEGQEEEA